jgi:transposase
LIQRRFNRWSTQCRMRFPARRPGDNPERIGSDAAFAKLCGVSPIEASSGKTVRHRLDRGEIRDANRALHVICVVRLRRHQPTRDYLARRIGEGRTKAEIMR